MPNIKKTKIICVYKIIIIFLYIFIYMTLHYASCIQLELTQEKKRYTTYKQYYFMFFSLFFSSAKISAYKLNFLTIEKLKSEANRFSLSLINT